jgi:uroporphyrinogen decarboxylase
MEKNLSRRTFVQTMLTSTALLPAAGRSQTPKSKRDALLSLTSGKASQEYIPAAFFIHFDKSFHFGEPAVRKHLEYFRHTGMDFMKIQYERTFPPLAAIKKPEDWSKMPSYKLDFYEPELAALKGLVREAKKEALILMTLYSPFMCAGHTAGLPELTAHLNENPDRVKKGFEIITDSLMLFVKECVALGVDGFYASTQGGEVGRFKGAGTFIRYVKPFDLVLMNEMKRTCAFNILHVCDYNGPYSDFSPFYDYPGHVVNCNPRLTTGSLAWKDVARSFGRPCMGGMDRHGILAKGSKKEIEAEVGKVLQDASSPFILGADCTLPGDIKWDNIKIAIDAAHNYKGKKP